MLGYLRDLRKKVSVSVFRSIEIITSIQEFEMRDAEEVLLVSPLRVRNASPAQIVITVAPAGTLFTTFLCFSMRMRKNCLRRSGIMASWSASGCGADEDNRPAEGVSCVLPAGLRVAEGGTRVERPACSSLHVSAFSSVGVGLAWAQNKKYK